MIYVQYAAASDRHSLEKLYNACFEGESEFAACFFDEIWRPDRTLVIRENGEVCACLHMLDLTFEKEGIQYAGVYIFGVATLFRCRRKGYAASLLEKCAEICAGNGKEFCALIVGEQSLLKYYEKHGFVSRLKASYAAGVSRNGNAVQLSEEHLPDISRIYDHAVADRMHVRRDIEYWKQQMKAYKVYGLIKNGKVISYCFGEIRDGIFYAPEACGVECADLVSHVAFAENTDKYSFLAPNGEKDITIGCIRPLSQRMREYFDKKTGYLNLYFN